MKMASVLTVASLLGPGRSGERPGCNWIFDRCMAGDDRPCADFGRCIDGIINKTLDPIDPLAIRERRYRCQQGDARACDADIAWRQGTINGYNGAIAKMNRASGPSWRESFGLGQ